MKYSLSKLKQELEKGMQHEFFFFWGHTQKNEGLIDKSCFSQWFPSPFTVDGVIYLTAEHWMMAKKADLFNDIDSKTTVKVRILCAIRIYPSIYRHVIR